MPNKVTMQQIADQLQVSKFAVSKALSGKVGVSAETRAKIVEAATQLGYFVQKRSLFKKAGVRRTDPDVAVMNATPSVEKRTVVVLIPNIRSQNRESLFWGRIMEGIATSLDQLGCGMMIVTEHRSDSFIGIVNPNGVLGLIGVGTITNQLLLEVRNLGIPFVLVDHEDPLIPSDSLFMNNQECVRRIVNHLIGLGHRRFQFVGNPHYSRSFFDRWSGFRSVMEEQGLESELLPSLLQLQGYDQTELAAEIEEGLRPVLSGPDAPTAYVCANDTIAVCVSYVLKQAGIPIPEACSVTGFDNIEDAALASPPISTVDVAKEALGRRAVDTLLRRIDRPEDPLEKILLNGDFLLRGSVGSVSL